MINDDYQIIETLPPRIIHVDNYYQWNCGEEIYKLKND